jgi:hypothetical protein
VLGVVPLAEIAADTEQLPGDDLEATPLDPRENFARERPAGGIRLDQDERALHGHGRGS